MAGFEGQIAHGKWPTYDEAKCKDAQIEMVVQINGKLRGRFVADAGIEKDPQSPPPKRWKGLPPSWRARPLSRRSMSPASWSIWWSADRDAVLLQAVKL